jgi:hypothetical protein
MVEYSAAKKLKDTDTIHKCKIDWRYYLKMQANHES